MTPTQTSQTRSPRARRRWQFSLRAMLLMVLLLSGLFSWIVVMLYGTPKQRRAVKAIEQLGATVRHAYSWQRVRRPGWRAFCDEPTIDDARFRLLAPHLQALGVSVLYLDNSQITDVGLAHLKGLTSLELLNLDGTQVTDAGLVHLKGLRKLEELYLGRTQITDAGLEHLKQLTSLRVLDLEETNVSDAKIKELEEALPEISVVGVFPR